MSGRPYVEFDHTGVFVPLFGIAIFLGMAFGYEMAVQGTAPDCSLLNWLMSMIN